jgi:hypothetical protein
MRLIRLIEFLRQHLKTVIRICCGFLAVLVLLDAFLVSKAHAHTSMERWPAFWSIFGFIGCVVIIIGSKWFGHAGIMKGEDYYDE